MDYKTEREVEVKLLHPLFRDTLGYADKDLNWAQRVSMNFGHEKKTKEADLVVYFKGKPVITVEAKKPTVPVQAFIGQLDSYAFHLQTPYSIITNGRQFVLRGYYSFNSRINVIDETVDGLVVDHWKKIRNLISFENIHSAISEPENAIAIPDDEKIKDYRRFFRKIHNSIRDRDKLDPAAAFDELSKLLFLKAAEDEWRIRKSSKPVLSAAKIREWETLGAGTAKEFVNKWFQSATTELFPGVFDDHPQINLAPATLASVLEDMTSFHIKNGDLDVKGRAFEEFLPSQLRGEGLGQFFTPRSIVDFMVEMAGISIHDVVADFACGSGGFLIKAFEQMQRGVEQLPAGTLQRMGTTRNQLLEEVKSFQVFGIDAEPRAARTAKMNMLMWGDGKKVVRGNALDSKDHAGNPYELSEYTDENQGSGCTLILANPPFGSREKDKHVLKLYELGGKTKEKPSEKTEILFIEKGLKLLRPEGKMLIVLPQGLLSGMNNARVRDFIHSQAEIRAVVSLPTHTFVQSGVPTVNTCVLYLQKFTSDKKKMFDEKTAGLTVPEIRNLIRTDPDFDYQIFMGTAEFVGYEPSGRVIAEEGEETDLDLLLKDFANKSALSKPNVDLFEFASTHYGEKSFRRKDQTIRGTSKGLKTSFVVSLSETTDRLDPPYYLWRYQAYDLIESLKPLGNRLVECSKRMRPSTEDELDREHPFASVNSDGTVTTNEFVRGEDFAPTYKPKHVDGGDFVYNPMRVNIGSIGIVPNGLENAITSPDYVVFKTKGINSDFLLHLLRSPFYRMYIDVISTGSIRDRLYFEDLQTIRIPDVSAKEELVVASAVDRTDQELRRTLEFLNGEKAKAIGRIHSLVKDAGAMTQKSATASKKFATLARKWDRETGFQSSIKSKISHPAYLKIIDMGEVALPYIFAELRKAPNHWFSALETITGASPVDKAKAKDMKAATSVWLKWGRENGYVKDESIPTV
jgi:type I restriction enzyme M protein